MSANRDIVINSDLYRRIEEAAAEVGYTTVDQFASSLLVFALDERARQRQQNVSAMKITALKNRAKRKR